MAITEQRLEQSVVTTITIEGESHGNLVAILVDAINTSALSISQKERIRIIEKQVKGYYYRAPYQMYPDWHAGPDER